MNTFWLKIAGLVVAIVAVIVLINRFSAKSKPPARPEPEPGQKTFHDLAAEDSRRLLAKPEKVDAQTPAAEESVDIQARRPKIANIMKASLHRSEFLMTVSPFVNLSFGLCNFANNILNCS